LPTRTPMLSIGAFDGKGLLPDMNGEIVEVAKAPDGEKLLRRVQYDYHNEHVYLAIPTGVARDETLLQDRIMVWEEINEKLLAEIQKWQPQGERAKHFGFMTHQPKGYLLPEIYDAVGFTGKYGGIQRACFLKKGDQWQPLLMVKMRDEPVGPTLEEVATNPMFVSGFRDYLKQKGFKPMDFLPPATMTQLLQEVSAGGALPAEERLWEMVRPARVEDAQANPALYYHTHLYRNTIFIEQWRTEAERLWQGQGTEQYGFANTESRTYFDQGYRIHGCVNISPAFLDEGHLRDGIDLMNMFKLGANKVARSEDWCVSPRLTQTNSYLVSVLRAGTKYNANVISMYLVSTPRWAIRPETVRLNAYSEIAQGAKVLVPYCGVPTFTFTEACSFMESLPMLRTLQNLVYEIGQVEDYIMPSKVVPAQVALGWSTTTDIWDMTENDSDHRQLGRLRHPDNNVYSVERQSLYLGLLHNQTKVDILSEEDVIDGYLKDYRVYFLVADHLRPEAAQAIKKWVAAGGTLVSLAGGGLRDHLDKEQDILKDVLGIKGQNLIKREFDVRPKATLLHLAPVDTITFVSGKTAEEPLAPMPVLAFKQELEPDQAQVWGRYENGDPAVLHNKFGKGQAITFGALPGLAYVKSAVPMLPFGRGIDPEKDLSARIVTDYDPNLRRIIDLPLQLAHVRKRVETSEPLVESGLLKADDAYVIPMANWGLQAIANLQVTLRDLGPVKSVASQQQGDLQFTRTPDGVTAQMPLTLTDFLIVKKK